MNQIKESSQIEWLENGDLIFMRDSENWGCYEHCMIYYKNDNTPKGKVYDVVHVTLRGLNHGSFEQYKDDKEYRYTIIRLPDQGMITKQGIINKVKYFLENFDYITHDEYGISTRIGYNYYSGCAYLYLSQAYRFNKKQYSSNDDKEKRQLVKVCEIIDEQILQKFFERTTTLGNPKINLFQYYKYANRYNNSQLPYSRMTCSQFVLFCLIPRKIQDLCSIEKDFKLKSHQGYMKLLKSDEVKKLEIPIDTQNDIISEYNGMDKYEQKKIDTKSERVSLTLDEQQRISKNIPLLFEEIKETFLQVSPKALSPEELHQFITTNFSKFSLLIDKNLAFNDVVNKFHRGL